MEYYALSPSYRRSVYFFYDVEKNSRSQRELDSGKSFSDVDKLYYTVDKIDKYIDRYDMLPTSGGTLVSQKLMDILEEISPNDCECTPAVIIDKKGNTNSDFFALNVLTLLDCIDPEKSECTFFEKYPDTIMSIDYLYFDYNKIQGQHIFCLATHPKMIASDYLLERAKKSKLKGLSFGKEGNQLGFGEEIKL